MKRLAGCLLFSVLFLLVPRVFAQDSNQSSSGSGVLVSPPAQGQVSDQDSTDNNGGSDTPDPSDQGGSNSSGHHKHHQQADGDSDASSQGLTNSSGAGQ